MSIQHDSLDRYTLRGNLNTTKNSFHFRLYRQTWEELLFKSLSFKNRFFRRDTFF